MTSYSEKLKDPRWQKKRLKILSRDRFKCQSCLCKTKMLTVHHKYYIYGNEPWEYPNSVLITLCYECHEDVKNIDFKNLWRTRLKLRLTRKKDYIPDFIMDAMFKVFKLKHN